MNVINEQCDSIALLFINILAFPFALLPEFVVELHKQQRLISYVREKIIFANEIKDIRSPQPEEVGESFSRLTVGGIPVLFKCHNR